MEKNSNGKILLKMRKVDDTIELQYDLIAEGK